MSRADTTLFYRHGRFRVAGGVLPNALTAYRTYGDPANPCIVFPTCYGAKLDSRLLSGVGYQDIDVRLDVGLLGQDYMIGADKVHANNQPTFRTVAHVGLRRLWTLPNTIL